MSEFTQFDLQDKVKVFQPTQSKEYPKKRDVEIMAVMARKLPQILELFETLSKLRRVPPGTVKDYKVWNESLFATDEAGVLMRVGQTSMITHADIIPNLNDTITYVIDSGMSFNRLNFASNVFVTNLEITVNIPHSEDIDIHCFETDCSVLLKWDTSFKFSKVGDGIYKVRLPGFHALNSNCTNRIKLIFTAKLPKHLPINVLLAYDYVFLRKRLADTMNHILKRYTCVRVNGKLGIKLIYKEPDTKPELFVVKDQKIFGSDMYNRDGWFGIKELFSAEKYKHVPKEAEKKYDDKLKKLNESLNSPCNNHNQEPVNGTHDICEISKIFGLYQDFNEHHKIIVVCIQMMSEKELIITEQLSKLNPEHLNKGINGISDKCMPFIIKVNMAMEFDYRTIRRIRDFPGISIHEFIKALKTNVKLLIQMLNVDDKDKLTYSVNEWIERFTATVGLYQINMNVHVGFYKDLLLDMLFKHHTEKIKTISLVNGPESMWDLDQFDTVYSNS